MLAFRPFPRALCALLIALTALPGFAQERLVTFQGQLQENGAPFNGTVDLDFQLYDALTGGNPVGSPEQRVDWPVEAGLFQVELDFGAGVFDGSPRFLEVEVNGSPLSPRQRVTATPYALLAAGIASGAVGSDEADPSQIQLRVTGSCPTGEYVRVVNQDGSVVCGTDASSGGTVTRVDTGAGLTGGPITDTGIVSVAAGGIGAAQIDPAQVQERVSGTCPIGQSIRQIASDGTVVCEFDDDGGPGPREEQDLVRIVAINWVHGARSDTQVLLDGSVARGLVIGFGFSPGQPALVQKSTLNSNTLQVFSETFDPSLYGGEGGFRRTRINIDPILHLDAYGVDSGRIVEATTSTDALVAGVFLPLEDAVLNNLPSPQLDMVLRGDFVLDEQGRAIDGEHLQGQLPSGDRPRGVDVGVQGGRFESWLQVQ